MLKVSCLLKPLPPASWILPEPVECKEERGHVLRPGFVLGSGQGISNVSYVCHSRETSVQWIVFCLTLQWKSPKIRVWSIFYVTSVFTALWWFYASQNLFQNPEVLEERPSTTLPLLISLTWLPACLPQHPGFSASQDLLGHTWARYLQCSRSPTHISPFSVKFFSCDFDFEGFDGQIEHIWLMELPWG